MASKQKSRSSAAPADRPPAEDVARENYEREFGTKKPDAELPPADDGFEQNPEPGPAVDPDEKENADS
jgi:hypothetical protein